MKIRTNWKNRSEGGGGGSILDMLNALSSHAKLNTPPISSSNLVQQPPPVVANSSLLSTAAVAAAAAAAASGKMNLSSAQNALGLNLNLNLSAANSDSSSNGGGSSSHSTSTNNNNHSHNNNSNNNSNNNINNNNNNNSSNNNNNNSNLLLNTSANLNNNNNQSNFQQQMANSQIDSIEANKGYTFEEQFKQLYELSDDPKRKDFLDDLFQFMADRNQPVNRIPIMAKQVLDLYELYNLVVARGGLVEVINKKIWREITKGLNLPSSITSAAFTLRTQYMKYLYPYECAKNNFSHQDELQQAIDGNRREGRRAGATSLGSYAAYLGASGVVGSEHQTGSGVGAYSASPSPNHLFAGAHNLLAQAQAQQQQLQHQHQQQQNHHNHQHHQQQQQPQIPVPQQHHLHQDSRIEPQRPQSGSSSASPNAANFNQQRLYQDSIESDHDDEGSIDLGHSSKRNSPIDHEHQHLDPHNIHLNQQQTTDQQQQQMAAAAAAAAALRQQLGAAINFAGTQNFLGQLTNQTGAQANATQNSNSSPSVTNTNSAAAINPSGDISKQQQEQFLAALMATVNQQQQQHQQQQQPQATPNSNTNTDQQAAARAALSMMASNAMLIGPSNTPDAMAVAAAAQAIGVKGAFIILLL